MWNQRLGALSPAQRSKILLLRGDGITIEAIAKRYGVSVSTISRIEQNPRQVRNVKTKIDGDDGEPSLQEEIASVAVAATETPAEARIGIIAGKPGEPETVPAGPERQSGRTSKDRTNHAPVSDARRASATRSKA